MRPDRFRLFLTFGLCLALCSLTARPALGQALTAGKIVALRQFDTRHWLGAVETGDVLSSANDAPGPGDQWAYYPPTDSEGPYLLSFFGTRIALTSEYGGRVVHVPPVASAPPWNDKSVFFDMRYATHGPMVSVGDTVMLSVLPAPGMAQMQLVEQGAPAVAWTPEADKRRAGWTIVAVPSPAQGRLPMKIGVADGEGFFLRNSAGTYLQAPAQPATPATQGPSPAALSLADGAAPTEGRAGPPMHLGSRNYWLGHQTTRAGLSSSPTKIDGLLEAAFVQGNASRWTPVDPRNTASTARLYYGQQVCLKASDAGLLSANPGSPILRLSPNGCNPGGSWELWTVERAH